VGRFAESDRGADDEEKAKMASGIFEPIALKPCKTFRNLRVYGNDGEIAKLINSIEKLLVGGWYRDRVKERDQLKYGCVRFVFVGPSTEDRQAVAMVVDPKRYGVYVSNILPQSYELSCEVYNAILCDFFLRFIHPVATELELPWELTSDDPYVGKWQPLQRRILS
jgi:hypothetical protein